MKKKILNKTMIMIYEKKNYINIVSFLEENKIDWFDNYSIKKGEVFFITIDKKFVNLLKENNLNFSICDII